MQERDGADRCWFEGACPYRMLQETPGLAEVWEFVQLGSWLDEDQKSRTKQFRWSHESFDWACRQMGVEGWEDLAHARSLFGACVAARTRAVSGIADMTHEQRTAHSQSLRSEVAELAAAQKKG